MAVTITLLKFVLGAVVLVFAILDVDQQPFLVIVALVLMGVLTVEQFYDWFPTKSEPKEGRMVPTLHDYITAYMTAFKARRGDKMIHAAGRAVRVHTPGARVLYLPNGHHVNVTVDDSGIATQIEDDDTLSAIVRPHPIRLQLRLRGAPTAAARVRPRSIRTTAIPRR